MYEVLRCGENSILGDRTRAALQAPYGGEPHFADEIGVLSKELFTAAPPRIADKVEHWAEANRHAAGAGLAGDIGEDLFDQVRIPGAAQRRRNGEAGGPFDGQAVGCLFVQQRRNAQPRLFNQEPLERVRKGDRVVRLAEGVVHIDVVRHPSRIRRPAEVPQAVRYSGGGLLRRKDPRLDIDDLAFVEPKTAKLGSLLLKRHASQEVGHTQRDRRLRVAIDGALRRKSRARGQCGDRG